MMRQTERTAPWSASRSMAATRAPSRSLLVLAGYGAALLFFVGLTFTCLDSTLKVQHDSGVYLTLAKSLATSGEYRDIFIHDNPPHTRYPPVFPVLLAPIARFSGYNVVLMKVAMILLGALALLALGAFFRELDSKLMGCLVVMLTATSHGIVFYTESLMTEIPYLFFSVLVLLQAQRVAPAPRWSPTGLLVLVALISVTYLTRFVGLSLLAAVTTWTLLESQGPVLARVRRTLVIGALGAVPALVWMARNRLVGDQIGTAYWGDYNLVGQLVSMPERIGNNLYKYARHTGRVILFILPQVTEAALPLLMLAAVVVAGFAWCVLYRRTALEYYVVFYGVAVVLFPGTRPQRYLVPLIPFVWYYFLVALRCAYQPARRHLPGGAIGRRAWSAVAVGVIATLLAANTLATITRNFVQGGRESYYHVVGEERYEAAAHWARTHTPPKSVFLWAKPSLRYILSDRQAVRWNRSVNAESILQRIQDRQLDYVAVDAFADRTGPSVRHALTRYPDRFCLVYTDEVTQIY